MNRLDFLTVGKEILKNSCNQLDDVKAAFREQLELLRVFKVISKFQYIQNPLKNILDQLFPFFSTHPFLSN